MTGVGDNTGDGDGAWLEIATVRERKRIGTSSFLFINFDSTQKLR